MRNKSIREFILNQNPDHISVRITRSGQVIVRTNKQRGDGGKRPWSFIAGTVHEVARDMLPA